MPSSDAENRMGTIFMGPSSDRETTLDRLMDASQRELWNKKTEEEYMERVRAKATDSVRALLLQAKTRGEEIRAGARAEADALRAEAEVVRADAANLRAEAEAALADAQTRRDAAHAEGLAAARAEALAELNDTRAALAETTAMVLMGIHDQCGHIFAAWRNDLAALTREAVAKATGWVVDNERAAMLTALLDQSMRALLDRRRFMVRVNPVDAELVTEMLAQAHQANPHTVQWELAADPQLEPGSLIVESDAALVSNSREARRSVVDDILGQLTLPEGPADHEAQSAVTQQLVQGMEAHGIRLAEPEAVPEEFAANAAAPEFVEPSIADAAVADAPEVPVLDMPVADVADVANVVDVADGPLPARETPEQDAMPGDVSDAMFDVVPETPEAEPSAEPEPVPAVPAGEDDAFSREAAHLVEEFLGNAKPPADAGAAGLAGEDGALPPDVADDLLSAMGFDADGERPKD